MDPVPSVCLVQECTILISTCVVEDSGIAPNWLSPIFLRIDGRRCSATTNSSATLERTGVNEMGRRCLFMSLTRLFQEKEDFCKAVSHEVTSAILVYQNFKTATMLGSQTSPPVGVEPLSCVETFFNLFR